MTWDDLLISTGDAQVAASVNIPHHTRLKLKAMRRYRFKFAVDARDCWVIDAKRL